MPDAVVLSHELDLARLAQLTPEAVPNAVVAGDPCLDRLRESSALREEYRRALGAGDATTVVTVTSTWGPGSLLGRHPDLIDAFLSELELDRHIISAILHPNVWFAHGPWQVETWLADSLRSGLRLIPPLKGWQQTILASDVVVGDHGAVTGYAGAMLIPTILAAFPRAEVATGTAVDRLGRLAPTLDPRSPLPEQISAAIRGHDRTRMRQVADLASSRPDVCADILRSTFHSLMELPEPDRPAVVFPYAPADLTPRRESVRACRLAVDWAVGEGDTAVVRRWPAEVTASRQRGPRAVDSYLAAHDDHPRRDLRGNADILLVTETDSSSLDDVLAHTIEQRPACSVAIAAVDDTRYRLRHRRLGSIEAFCTGSFTGPMMSAVIAATAHDYWLIRRSTPPAAIQLVVGSSRIQLELKSIDPHIG
ncbi:hypothetical protein ACIP5Y_11660 [Nocardia sp. NPDC088792]|uniref:hypothetical protein n=1 Tax=Nocardia sp. NPDC088792 TaxID=3364332 RepID=UPI0038128161